MVARMAQTLEEAITAFEKFALDSFTDAHDAAKEAQPVNASEEVLADWARRVALAKGHMASALQQLISAAKMRSEVRGREGYEALVGLMQQTSTTAQTIYGQLTGIVDKMDDSAPNAAEQVARNAQLTALGSVLQALADLAPIRAWDKTP